MPAQPGAVEIIERLARERPAFHGGPSEERVWSMLPAALDLIARHVEPGDVTLELGSGASTVVFAACGARHTAISPDADEHRRIRAFLDSAGVAAPDLRFVAGRSEEVLPGLPPEPPLDAALVDGLHAFPHPVVDWHFTTRLLRVGGVVLLDDVPIPAVGVAFRFMDADPAWELLEVAADRTAAFRKLAEPPPGDPWRRQPFNDPLDFAFAPPLRRARLRARAVRGRVAGRFPALARLRRRLGAAP